MSFSISNTFGQISIDLIMTCLFVIVLSSSFFFISSNFKENQEEIALRNQLKLISSDLADFIIVSKTFDSTEFFAVDLEKKIDLVTYGGKKYLPTVTISNDELTASLNLTINGAPVGISEKSYFGNDLTKIKIETVNNLLKISEKQ
ncbi:MAG: hypothetical protein PHQ98_00390 [Candidatus ainarchaeum sp.]|nr:hypothetical protein [Candidatus ainarchaeum sp.]